MDGLSRLQFGDFEYDPAAFRLLRHGIPVPVEPKALDLLQLLVERAPRVVTKAEILSIVWKDIAVTDNALTRLVAQLRRVLSDNPKAPRYIETVTTRGYRFCEPVVRIPAAIPVPRPHASAPARPAADPGSAIQPASGHRLRVSTAVGGVLLLGLAAVTAAWFLRPSTSAHEASGAPDVEKLAALRPQQATTGKGFDGFLAFSPDGKSIAFSSDRSGALEIYVQGVAGGSTAIPLTNNGRHNVQPAWSPDGQFIAYHEMAGNGIWIVPSRGGVARRLSDFGAHAAWSPDGSRIAFQSLPMNDINALGIPGSLSTIWVVNAFGRDQPMPVTTPGEPPGPHLTPAWRDPRYLLFVVPSGTIQGNTTSLWVVGVDARERRQLGTHRKLSAEYVMAPGGRGIYFVSHGTNTIWWLPLAEDGTFSGEPQPTGLATGGSKIAQLAISQDGRRLAWTALDSTGHVWAADAGPTGMAAAPLTEGSGVRFSFPAPAADGRVVLVGSRPGSNASLYLLPPRAPLRQLTTDSRNYGGPRWMPGEREIAYVSYHDERPGFWALDPETGRDRLLFLLADLPLPPGGSQPSSAAPSTNVAITRDFTRLAWSLVREGAANVWTVSLHESRPYGVPVQRTFEREGGSYPTWSPDGRWLAYQCAEGTDTHVCVTGADGVGRIQLTREAGQSWVGGWGPDNDTIVFAARRQAVWNVAAVSRSTSIVRTLTQFTEPRMFVRYPRWDRAGNRVVFERSETSGRLWLVELAPVHTGGQEIRR